MITNHYPGGQPMSFVRYCCGIGFEKSIPINNRKMPENKNEHAVRDSKQVNLKDKAEVNYWVYRFNCTEAQLRDAVESVGTSVDRVGEYLHVLKGDKEGNLGV